MAKDKSLKRAERQLTLARIARRDAMAALADALEEENRSASLAHRTREMAKDYTARKGVETGGTLGQNKKFANELTQLARSAEQAQADALRQADWQVDALAHAEQRIERLDARAKAARTQQRDTQERVSQPFHQPVARKLQRRDLNTLKSNQAGPEKSAE